VDRAGAYTVDGPGSLIVARYDGCYQNVLGLPIVRLDKLLRRIGHSVVVQDTPSNRGMINKVRHLVRVEGE